MLVLLSASSTFVAPVAPVTPAAPRATVTMQSIDSDRRSRSPGLARNFYDSSTADFKRPQGFGDPLGSRVGDYDRPGTYDGARRDYASAGRRVGRYDYGYDERGGGMYGDRGSYDRGIGSYGSYRGREYSDRDISYGYGGGGYGGGYRDRYRGGALSRGGYGGGYGGGYRGSSIGNTALDLIANFGQYALLFAVLAAPKIPQASSVSALVGLLLISSGGVFAVSGALDLGRQELRTDGVYALCRHPTYAGIIAACVGLGFWSANTEQLLSRVLLTGALSALLYYKAEREEELLYDRYGMRYSEWAAGVPRFYPALFSNGNRYRFQGGRGGYGGGRGRGGYGPMRSGYGGGYDRGGYDSYRY